MATAAERARRSRERAKRGTAVYSVELTQENLQGLKATGLLTDDASVGEIQNAIAIGLLCYSRLAVRLAPKDDTARLKAAIDTFLKEARAHDKRSPVGFLTSHIEALYDERNQ